MDDRKLEVLLTTVRSGSFNKAASELHCTQSAVTQTVNAIEDELRCKIIERTPRGVHLSAAGEKLLPFLLEADRSLRNLREQALFVAQGGELPIRIGAFSSIANTWLPKQILAYQKLHPEVSFDIRIGSNHLSRWLLNGEIDLALGDSIRLRGFRWYPLMEDPYFAVLPREYEDSYPDALTHRELFALPFVMAPLNAIEEYFSLHPEREIRVKCDDDYTLLSMVEQGLGATAMPQLSLNKVSHQVAVRQLDPPVHRTLGAAISGNPIESVRQFVNYLKKNAGD